MELDRLAVNWQQIFIYLKKLVGYLHVIANSPPYQRSLNTSEQAESSLANNENQMKKWLQKKLILSSVYFPDKQLPLPWKPVRFER